LGSPTFASIVHPAKPNSNGNVKALLNQAMLEPKVFFDISMENQPTVNAV
jgi:hypothetical protein